MVSRVAEGGPASKSEGLKMNDEIIKVKKLFPRITSEPSAHIWIPLLLSVRSKLSNGQRLP